MSRSLSNLTQAAALARADDWRAVADTYRRVRFSGALGCRRAFSTPGAWIRTHTTTPTGPQPCGC